MVLGYLPTLRRGWYSKYNSRVWVSSFSLLPRTPSDQPGPSRRWLAFPSYCGGWRHYYCCGGRRHQLLRRLTPPTDSTY